MTPPGSEKPKATFDRMAAGYDRLTNWYSNGRVRMAKLSQAEYLRPGDRVLFAGVGTGEDAIEASRRGASVTAVDLSREMTELVIGRAGEAGVDVEVICESIFDHNRPEGYDVVAANFLLDCFPQETALDLMRHLAGQVHTGGLLMIADVTRPTGSLPGRVFARAHHFGAFAFTWVQGLTPLFPLYDYPEMFSSLGIEIVDRKMFRLWPGGPVMFQNLVGRVGPAPVEVR